MTCTCMQGLEILLFVYFCEEILQNLIYRNFVRDNRAQNGIWSSLLQISIYKDSREIYVIFFQVLFHFIRILEY
jgi:hypothetical protein